MKNMETQTKIVCDLCASGDGTLVDINDPVPKGETPPAPRWAHSKCDQGARRNDRALRSYYIAAGLIRPKGT